MALARVLSILSLSCLPPPAAAADPDLHLRLDLQAGGQGMLMVGADAQPLLTWELPGEWHVQDHAEAVVSGPAGMIYRLAASTADQNLTLSLPPLEQATVYSVRVTVTAGGTSMTSLPLRFFAALRRWDAVPVWSKACEGAISSPNFAWFRGSLALPPGAELESALAFVSAEGPLTVPPDGCCNEEEYGSKILAAYKLLVGGKPIGIGPGRPRCAAVSQGACEPQTPYDGFALEVPEGATKLDVEIHAYGLEQPKYGVARRVIFQLVVRLKGGGVLQLSTGDGGWQAFDADCPSCSLFNPTGNSGGKFGATTYWYSYPHENLNASCMPDPATGWREEVVATSAFAAPLAPKPVLPLALSDYAVGAMREVAAGHFSFALETEVQGGLRLTLPDSGRFAGASAAVLLAEALNSDGSVMVPMHTGATFSSNFSLAPGAVLEHHEYMNWRFGEVAFRDESGKPLPVGPDDFRLTAWVVKYPYDDDRATQFESSSAVLDRVWALNQNSVKHLSLDVYTDSNARQRSDSCQADNAVAQLAQFAATPELAMQRYEMQKAMDYAPRVWPYPPPTGPGANGTGGYVSPNWADWTILPAMNVVNDALFSGDLGQARQYFDYILEYHLYQHMINASGTVAAGLVVDNSAGLSCLIDTSGGSNDGFVQSHANSIVQAWVYHGMVRVSQLARWIGRHGDADLLDTRAATMKEAFNRLMVMPSGVVCDGLCVENKHTSIHSSFYALAFGIVGDGLKAGAFAYIKERIDGSAVGFPGGAYAVQFLLLALYNVESDRGHLAFDVLTSDKKHSWVAMMRDHRATTTMECWSPDELPNLSFSHIWSASPSFLIPWFLAGVRPESPGWSKITIKPQPGPLASFSLSVPTVRGPVRVRTLQEFGGDAKLSHFRLEASVPGNTVARLHVPRPLSRSSCVMLDGVELDMSSTASEPYLGVEVLAGTHTLEWCSPGSVGEQFV